MAFRLLAVEMNGDATKSTVAEAFHIAGKSITRLEVLVRELVEVGCVGNREFCWTSGI